MQPQEIKRVENYIHILWVDQHKSVYEINYLRRKCPCVICRENQARTTDGGVELPSFTAKRVEILKTDQVGRYAIQFTFSDGHDTGIYSYDHLRKICPCSECLDVLNVRMS